MEGSVGAPPQRVCPKCARVSWATGPQCPYCTAKFRRAKGVEPWMLVVATLAILIGFAVMFLITVNQVNDRVDEVNSQIDRSVDQLRTDVRKELDARIPPGANGVGTVPATPTPDPLLTPTETPTPDPLSTETVTPTPTAEATTTPDASASPEATEEPTIIEP